MNIPTMSSKIFTMRRKTYGFDVAERNIDESFTGIWFAAITHAKTLASEMIKRIAPVVMPLWKRMPGRSFHVISLKTNFPTKKE